MRDTVAGIDDGTDFLAGGLRGEGVDVLVDGALDVVSGNFQFCHSYFIFLLCVTRISSRSVGKVIFRRGEPRRKRTVDHFVTDSDSQPA